MNTADLRKMKVEELRVEEAKLREELLKTDSALNEKVYYDVAEDEKVYAYKKQKAAELMQLQSDVFYNKQKEAMS